MKETTRDEGGLRAALDTCKFVSEPASARASERASEQASEPASEPASAAACA